VSDFRYNSASTVQTLPFALYFSLGSFPIGLGQYAGSQTTFRLYVDYSALKVEGIYGSVNDYSGSAQPGRVDVIRLVLPEESAVPEPAIWLLFTFGIGVIAAMTRCRHGPKRTAAARV
jgi:hypothetical protein